MVNDLEFRKIVLYPNVESDVDFLMARQVGDVLRKCGKHVVICPLFIDGNATIEPPSGYEIAELENELEEAEMIITFGGDGTILRAARSAAEYGVPILGINMGGKGFMAELEADEIGLLEAAVQGKFKIESRMMIDIEVQRDGENIYSNFALNDVVVKGDNKVIDMTLFGDSQRITRFSGDGTVIATPTGSTAYSMSAGGPIVDPEASNIIITPICAHVLEARSFVLVSDRQVSIEIGQKKRNPAYISVDGVDHVNIRSGDIVKVYKSERYTKLVRLSDRSFYRKVSEKLGEKV
jgi:NAD+ kinase